MQLVPYVYIQLTPKEVYNKPNLIQSNIVNGYKL